MTADLMAISLGVTAVLRLLRSATAGAAGYRGTHLFIGILAALAGLYCLGPIQLTVVPLSLVAGLFWVLHGLADLVIASSAGPGRGLVGGTGALSLLAGLMAIFWPAISVPVLAAIMGAWLACAGPLLAVTALYLRHAARVAAAG